MGSVRKQFRVTLIAASVVALVAQAFAGDLKSLTTPQELAIGQMFAE